MTAEPLQAWLIHKTLSGDTSLRLRFLTREKGVIDCHYRGGRTAKKTGALQPFTPLWLLINERHQWFYVNRLETSGLPLALKSQALFSGLYINELLFHTITPQEQDEQLFIAYQHALHDLEIAQHQSTIEVILRRFEKIVLTACGYSLSLASITTDSPFLTQIKASAFYQFTPDNGFREAEKGIPGAHLVAFATDNFEKPEVLKTAKWIMRQAIDHLLGGRPLKSRTLFKSAKGFTLIELMIVMMIIGILASIAYPNYLSYLTKARRSDGQTALIELATQMERYYTQNHTYQSATIGTGTRSDIRFNPYSPEGWYHLSITAQTESSYTLQATAVKAQLNNDRSS